MEAGNKLNETIKQLCSQICTDYSRDLDEYIEEYMTNLMKNNPNLRDIDSRNDIVLGDVAMELLDKNFDGEITESEINNLIQKSVEMSILIGIRSFCKDCKERGSQPNNQSSVTSKINIMNMKITEPKTLCQVY